MDLVESIRNARESDHERSLTDLLHGIGHVDQEVEQVLSRDELIDLICIDLIQRWRAGHHVLAEEYLEAFPSLCDKTAVLDVIDAEICIRRELGSACDLDAEMENFSKRFPDLDSEIHDLLSITMIPDQVLPAAAPVATNSATGQFNTLIVSAEAIDSNAMDSEQTQLVQSEIGDSEFDVSIRDNQPSRDIANQQPVDVPEWFLGQQCIASSPGRWLIRGRDATRGDALAMKILEYPPGSTQNDAELVMDVCEMASKVSHPCWVQPSVAATQNRCIAIIRPWRFGNPWSSLRDASQIPGRLKLLSKVAFVLQAAHRTGAVHGGVHPNNILLDHRDGIHLIDAGSSASAILAWMNVDKQELRNSLADEGWRSDAHQLIKLVMMDAVDAPGSWMKSLSDQLSHFVEQHGSECCGVIGDHLIRVADSINGNTSQIEPRQSWRQKLSQWVAGN